MCTGGGLSMLLGWVPFFLFLSLFLYAICWCAIYMYFHVPVMVLACVRVNCLQITCSMEVALYPVRGDQFMMGQDDLLMEISEL